MARGDKTAQAGEQQGLTSAQTLGGQSATAYNTLMPELTNFATNPPGYDPTTLARMNTGAQQTAGGTAAGATGQGALLASRTRNPGTAAAAVSESARRAGQNLSETGLNIQNENAKLKERQRAEGLSGLGTVYGTSTEGANRALAETAANSEANTKAADESWNWARYILDPAMNNAGQAGSAALMAG